MNGLITLVATAGSCCARSAPGGRGLPHIAATPESVAAINRKLVAGAGHFAFLLCGPSIKAVAEFCTDAPGFDRLAFHKQFNADGLGYFRTQLGSSWTQPSQ